MTTLAMSIESLVHDSDELVYMGSAMTVTRPTPGLHNALTYMLGLESATYLTGDISQEGLFSWINEKLSSLGRKFNVALNKAYAKITRADDDTKRLIKQASIDKNIKLPISGIKATAIIAGGIALVTLIVFLTHCARLGKMDDAKYDALKEKFFKEHEYTHYTISGHLDIDSNGAINEQQFHRMHKEDRKKLSKMERQLNQAERRQEAGFKGIVGDEAKRFLSGLTSIFPKILNALKGFGSVFKSKPSSTDTDKKEAGSRLSVIGKCITSVFSTFWKWFTSGWRKVVSKKKVS